MDLKLLTILRNRVNELYDAVFGVRATGFITVINPVENNEQQQFDNAITLTYKTVPVSGTDVPIAGSLAAQASAIAAKLKANGVRANIKVMGASVYFTALERGDASFALANSNNGSVITSGDFLTMPSTPAAGTLRYRGKIRLAGSGKPEVFYEAPDNSIVMDWVYRDTGQINGFSVPSDILPAGRTFCMISLAAPYSEALLLGLEFEAEGTLVLYSHRTADLSPRDGDCTANIEIIVVPE